MRNVKDVCEESSLFRRSGKSISSLNGILTHKTEHFFFQTSPFGPLVLAQILVFAAAGLCGAEGNAALTDARPIHPGQSNSVVLKHATIAPVPGSTTAASAPATVGSSSTPKITMPTAANTNLPALTRVADIRSLSALEASRGYPIKIIGVLTYSPPRPPYQFFHDDSAGIFVDFRHKSLDKTFNFTNLPPTGERVELTGFTGPGEYAPVIQLEEEHALGEGSLPVPKSSTLQAMMTGSEDSQWVSIKGVVRSQGPGQGTLADFFVLSVSIGDADVDVHVPKTVGSAPQSYVDAGVEVHGVCATSFDAQRRLRGIRLFVPDWEQVKVEDAAPEDPFALPVRPVTHLLQFHADGSNLHRSHVQGTVLLRRNDNSFYLQDDSGGILIRPQKDAPPVKTGSRVELIGFPSLMDKFPVLLEAVARPVTGGRLPEPTVLSVESSTNEALHCTLVRLQGRVLGQSTVATEEYLTLQFGQWIAEVIFEKQETDKGLAKVAPGSVVSLTGVYLVRLDDNQNIKSFQMLLRSPEDVQLISRPSWWTAQHALWVFTGLGSVLLVVLGWVSLLRKEVRQRTKELRAEIEERKRMEAQVEKTHRELMVVSRQAGMAEVATSVLHNVGNVLNSVNVSASLVADQIKRSRASNVGRVAAMMKEHAADLGNFLTRVPKGRQLPDYLEELSKHLTEEREFLLSELSSLTKNVEHIKEIVAVQQNYANVMGVNESVQVTELVEGALRINTVALDRHGVRLVREYESNLPEIMVDKHKVLQILINVVRNAKYACDDSGREDKQIIVRVTQQDGRIKIAVVDNGVGISPENLTRIFNHGFTTRKNGHGFGLHSGALAAKELGGVLLAHSDGVGRGASFTLELPTQVQPQQGHEVVRRHESPALERADT